MFRNTALFLGSVAMGFLATGEIGCGGSSGGSGGAGAGGTAGSAGGGGGKGGTGTGTGGSGTGGTGGSGTGGAGGQGAGAAGSGGASGFAGALTPFTFSVDTSAQKSGLIGYDPLTLTVTDQSGIVWTLNVPAGARFMPETISMAPITGIVNAAGATVPVAAGVIFEPDGLELAGPAILTAQLPSATGTVMVTYSADGQTVDFADAVLAGNTYTSNVYHFSGQGVGDPTDEAVLCQTLKTLAGGALASLQAYIAQPQPSPLPVPSDTNYECPTTDGKSAERMALNAFMKQLNSPELRAIQGYLALMHAQVNPCGADNTDALDDQTICSAYARLAARASMEASQYGSNTAKIPAVITAELAVGRQQELLCGTSDTSNLATLCDALVNGLLQKVRADDFMVTSSTVSAMRQDTVVHGSASDTGKLVDALAMTVTVDNTASSVGLSDSGDPSTTTHTSILIKSDIVGQNYSGATTGNYTASSVAGACCSDAQMTGPSTFPMNVTLAFSDVCDTANAFNVTVTADVLGALDETWNLCSVDLSAECSYFSQDDDVAEGSNELAFMSNYLLGFFSFNLPATDGQPNVAQKMFTGAFMEGPDSVDSSITFAVQHTPQ